MIKISDVARQNLEHYPEIISAIESVIRSGQYIKGEFLDQFEMEFARYHGVRHCIGVNSGTDAIYIALKAAGIGPGDEVITSAMSYLATAEAIKKTGARPVFVDITNDGRDLMNPDNLPVAINQRTKAIVPVHLHGYMCDMGRINSLADAYGLIVIEDCAQATGAYCTSSSPNGRDIMRKAGTFGLAGAFSFFPTKNLGAIGDGGAIITNDDKLAEQARIIREHGCIKRNFPILVGENSRLDAIQAAVLSAKLPYLDEWNSARFKIAEEFEARLIKNIGFDSVKENENFKLPPVTDEGAVFHHYPIRIRRDKREALFKKMAAQKIELISYYDAVLPMMDPWIQLNMDWEQSNAYSQSVSGFSFPIFPEITNLEIDHIVYWFADFIWNI